MLLSVWHYARWGETMNEELLTLSAIDFLPQRYREARSKRSASMWRLTVVFALATMLLSTAYLQQCHLWEAKDDLARIDSLHAVTVKVAQELAAEQARFPAVDKEAELFTYLRHPWPRTQILNAVLTSVPKSVRLTSFGFGFELPEKPAAEGLQTVKEDPVDKTPSPARDLKQLREQLDGGRWVVSLAGTAADLAELHAYLAKLEQHKLFAKVELVSIESPQSTESTNSQFAVRISLRPGYGQPGGPAIKTGLPLAAPISLRGFAWQQKSAV
jgi:hypothetical protein